MSDVWCSKCFGDHYTNDCPTPTAIPAMNSTSYSHCPKCGQQVISGQFLCGHVPTGDDKGKLCKCACTCGCPTYHDNKGRLCRWCDDHQGGNNRCGNPDEPKAPDVEVDLPPLDEKAISEIHEATDSAFRTDDLYSELDKVRAILHCRERQLKAEIAAHHITLDASRFHAEMGQLKSELDELRKQSALDKDFAQSVMSRLEAELSSLRKQETFDDGIQAALDEIVNEPDAEDQKLVEAIRENIRQLKRTPPVGEEGK